MDINGHPEKELLIAVPQKFVEVLTGINLEKSSGEIIKICVMVVHYVRFNFISLIKSI